MNLDEIMHHSLWLYTLCYFFPSFTKMGPYCSHGHWWRTAIILYLIISAALICIWLDRYLHMYMLFIDYYKNTIWQNIATSAHALTWSLYCPGFFCDNLATWPSSQKLHNNTKTNWYTVKSQVLRRVTNLKKCFFFCQKVIVHKHQKSPS